MTILPCDTSIEFDNASVKAIAQRLQPLFESSLETCSFVHLFALRFWPGQKIDTLLDLPHRKDAEVHSVFVNLFKEASNSGMKFPPFWSDEMTDDVRIKQKTMLPQHLVRCDQTKLVSAPQILTSRPTSVWSRSGISRDGQAAKNSRSDPRRA